VEKLLPGNPPLFFEEVMLWEDELSDRGNSKAHVRFRVMKDCWFILLRSYMRLDNVSVRILDTQVFFEFGASEIIRDFKWKESSWADLQKKGFNLNSEWLLNPYQGDMIYDFL
jgi:type 2A phosphatase activator TIP41